MAIFDQPADTQFSTHATKGTEYCRFIEENGPFAGTTVDVWNSFVDGIQYSINGRNMGRIKAADRLLFTHKTFPPQIYIDSKSILLL